MSRHNGLPGYDAWKTRSDLDDADMHRSDDSIECEDCGNYLDHDWDYSNGYRICAKCLAKEDDEAADRDGA